MENFRLKVFRTVAAEMSFRKAAEVLHLSQPAVSQQVRSLEEEAGARLFDRGSSDGHGSGTGIRVDDGASLSRREQATL